ncbi:MAG: aminodeoxychorismate synthase component I [Myxococcota bacterium]
MFRVTGATACASRPVVSDDGLPDLFERLRMRPYPWLLDSALPSERLGRASFAGADPYLVMRANGSRVRLDCLRAERPGLTPGCSVFEADPLDVLRALLPRASSPANAAFAGGAVGYLGYELSDQIEPIGLGGVDDLAFPDLCLLFVDRVLAQDGTTGELTVHALGFAADDGAARARAEEAAEEFTAQLAEPVSASPRRVLRRAPAAPHAFFDSTTYAKAVSVAKQEIAAGNAYQVCLTHREERDFRGDPWDFYRRLRTENPAPFASYLELPEGVIASTSPERFLRLSAGGEVESRPIKGTRPRGAEASEDRTNRQRLACSAKDRAENLMIVDLVRNDLGRVCEHGSVEVPELMVIESYASVHQMVSTVRGRLRADCDAVDLLRATFPPGSMTGAPKIAAMKILDRLEPVRRGVYSGALGYVDVRGGLDLCVVIRTALLCDGRAYVHSGGGIVSDSDPHGEYREACDKARPLLAALDRESRSVGAPGSPATRPGRRRWISPRR